MRPACAHARGAAAERRSESKSLMVAMMVGEGELVVAGSGVRSGRGERASRVYVGL